MGNRQLHVRNFLASLAVATLLWVGPPAIAQSPQNNPSPRDNDTTRAELANFDRFLDSHQDIAEQLRKDASAVLNGDFLNSHPDLQTYLQNHPAVREELTENPNRFMRAENRYDRQEDRQRLDNNRQNDPDRDTTRRELASFDSFLDSHRETAEQLRRDPSQINNSTFIQNHPDLQVYLQDHPAVREELTENPNAFMRSENRYDRQEDRRRLDNNRQGDSDRDTTGRELASFDRFLDSHRETAEQLRRDPSQIKSSSFVQSHPALQAYLQEHPAVREELTENPNAFMRAENRYDRQEDRRRFDNRGPGDVGQDNARQENQRQDNMRRDNETGNRQNDPDRDTTRRELASFDRFLDSHRETAEQLRRDPSQIKSSSFVQNHPALQAYLQEHPAVREELSENPNAFMRAENRYDRQEDRTTADRRDTDRNMGRDMDRDNVNRRDNDRDNATRRDSDRMDADRRGADVRRDNDTGRADMDRAEMSRNMGHGEVAGFREFLGSHTSIAEQLSKDPSLAKNQQYLDSHPELKAYLNAHPGVQTAVVRDPNAFFKPTQSQQPSSTTNPAKTASPDATKPKQ